MTSQIGFFDDPIEAPKPDTVADALIQNRFAPNSFILDLNKGLTVSREIELSYPWNLPSRLFIFPIEVTDQLPDGTRRLGLLHPLLADHPYVKQVEQTMGVTIDRDGAPNEYGYSKVSAGQWWHAVDLISRGMWRELLDTARFTTPEHIAGAVCYGLHYSPHEGKKRNGYISTSGAREIMAAIDSVEPPNSDEIIDQHFMRPSPCQAEKGSISWPINQAMRGEPYATAWGHILGIEAGYFAHDRAGFLGWTPLGRERFPPQERVVAPKVERHVEPPPEPPVKPAAALADEIAPRPARKADEQMDLF